MHPFLLLKLVSAIASAVLGTATIARDPGLRVNRLMGTAVLCGAWWSLCEVVWNLQADPDVALWWVRFSSFGWMWLGPLSFHIFVELRGDLRSRLHRLLPASYAIAAVANFLYVATPWCVAGAIPVSWGWSYEFGPMFPVAYHAAALPPALVLVFWRRVYPRDGSRGERRISRLLFAGALVAVVVSSLTDALLPWLGVPVPPLGSTVISALAIGVAWNLNRVGYSLLSPGAFAQEILGTLRDGLAVLHPDGRIRTANRALEVLVRVGQGGLEGRRLSEFLSAPAVRVEPAGPVRAELRRYEESIPVSLSRAHLQGGDGVELGEAALIRDLREVEHLRDRVITQGRLAAVGELSEGIARGIARPLELVEARLVKLREGWVALAERARDADLEQDCDVLVSEGEEILEESLQGVERIRAIAREVRGFASPHQAARLRVDVNDVVDGALRMAAARTPRGVRIERRSGSELFVEVAPDEMAQVLLNLLLNALDAVGGEGVVTITTERAPGRVVIRIADDGPGIARAVRDRIFDPFFTTKPVGEGTGLGLAISDHIVEKHGGEMRVESEDGCGASFEILLPTA